MWTSGVGVIVCMYSVRVDQWCGAVWTSGVVCVWSSGVVCVWTSGVVQCGVVCVLDCQ